MYSNAGFVSVGSGGCELLSVLTGKNLAVISGGKTFPVSFQKSCFWRVAKFAIVDRTGGCVLDYKAD